MVTGERLAGTAPSSEMLREAAAGIRLLYSVVYGCTKRTAVGGRDGMFTGRISMVWLRCGPLLALLVLLAQVSAVPAPAYAQALETPTPIVATATPVPYIGPTADDIGSSVTSGVMGGLSSGLPNLILKGFLALIAVAANWLHAALGEALGGANFLTQTPPEWTYGLGAVTEAAGFVRGVANAGLVLTVLWLGITMVIGRQTGAPYHEAMEIVPRVALGALFVNTAEQWSRLGIEANNALSVAVNYASGLPGWEAINALDRTAIEGIAVLAYLVIGVVLLLQLLLRLALINVLYVAAPLALLCWVLPITQRWARLWTTLFAGVVFSQFLQVLALKLGGALLGLAGVQGGLIPLLLGLATLVLAIKIPGLVALSPGGTTMGMARRALSLIPGGQFAGAAAGTVAGVAAGAAGRAIVPAYRSHGDSGDSGAAMIMPVRTRIVPRFPASRMLPAPRAGDY